MAVNLRVGAEETVSRRCVLDDVGGIGDDVEENDEDVGEEDLSRRASSPPL